MDKISPIKKRILQYLTNQGITKVEFCEKTGISYANMKGKSLFSEIGGDKLAEILSIYGEISPDWLILGVGEMLREEKKEVFHVESSEKNDQGTDLTYMFMRFEELIRENEDYKKEIEFLKIEIACLEAENTDKEQEVEQLKQSRGKAPRSIPYSDNLPKIGTHLAAEPRHK